MKTYILMLSILILSGCSHQISNNCHASAILACKETPIAIYDKPGGSASHFVMDVLEKDIFYGFKIIKTRKEYAYVSFFYTDGSDVPDYGSGWIEIKYLGIRPVLPDGNSLPLYSRPDRKSKVKSRIMFPAWEYIPSYIILKCYRDWLYVVHNEDGISYTGWMAPENQCSNPLSSCN